jgi:predicted ferric reductase
MLSVFGVSYLLIGMVIFAFSYLLLRTDSDQRVAKIILLTFFFLIALIAMSLGVTLLVIG